MFVRIIIISGYVRVPMCNRIWGLAENQESNTKGRGDTINKINFNNAAQHTEDWWILLGKMNKRNFELVDI